MKRHSLSMFKKISTFVTLIFCTSMAAGACVGQVDGGAVELAWGIRDTSGEPVQDSLELACKEHNITAIRLCWEPTNGQEDLTLPECECNDNRDVRFECKTARGISDFTVEPGETAFFIRPICPRPNEEISCGDLTKQSVESTRIFQLPPPVVREVKGGDVIAFNQFLIVAPPDSRCSNEISSP
jgi:hypothetical protein